MKSPTPSASYWSSQSSPRMPLCTSRSTLLPPARPSMRYSKAMNVPSGFSWLRNAKRRPGSQAVTVPSSVKPPMVIRVRPPSRGSISLRPMNHESIPGPEAIASHTSSGEAGNSICLSISNSWPIAGLLRQYVLAKLLKLLESRAQEYLAGRRRAAQLKAALVVLERQFGGDERRRGEDARVERPYREGPVGRG